MSKLQARLGDESGFTMAIALGVLTVTMLLMAAAFVAARGDINNSQHDLDGKRAYLDARAGLNAFLYKLNKNTELWQSCPTQATTAVPGTSSGQTYSYKPLPANGKTACSTSDPVHTMIELSGPGTGSFRMQFTGTSGTSGNANNAPVSKTIVVSFRRDSTLDYLYYSIYETLDPNTYANPANYAQCATLLRNGRSSTCGTISWITGDKINGPMYTQDQFAICGSPTFGRVGGNDTVESPVAPPTPVTYTNGSCSNGLTVNGDVIQNADQITPPPDNSSLLAYAQQDGKVFVGASYISISGNTASVSNTASGCNPCSVNLDTYPIIYVTNGSGCSNTSYSPYNVSYADTACGNAYVVGNYSSSVTIASQNDVIVAGNITTDLNGPAVMGLVANNFIRVMHGVTTRSGTTQGACGSAANVSSQTFPSLRIDAAVLALKHSFIVDNYDCGAPITGNLTVNGAIAQIFRGTVGTTNNGNSISGYLKNYNYDDRLAAQQPPYLFDLASASWKAVRETSCVAGATAASGVAC